MRLFEKYRYWVIQYRYPVLASYGEFSGSIDRFYLELMQNKKTVEGWSIERDFRNPYSNKLIGARLNGNLKNKHLEILKTYLPGTGMKHSIMYKAFVDFENGKIVGTWSHDNSVPANLKVGSFEMYLDEGKFYQDEILEPEDPVA